jgi:CubicO group peptidase (beta-lactamase class C family)
LDLDFHVGLADSEFDRVAHIARGKGNLGDAAAQRLLKVMMSDASAMSTRSFTNPPSIMTSTNKPTVAAHAATGGQRAPAMHAAWRAFTPALLDGSLLDAELLGEMTREHSVGDDKTLLTRTRFGLGCMLDQSDVANATYGMGAKAFGHPGAGGSSGFADPERDLAFGFVTNNLGPFVLMDPRAQKLARQNADCT